jgi:hypothetical protein
MRRRKRRCRVRRRRRWRLVWRRSWRMCSSGMVLVYVVRHRTVDYIPERPDRLRRARACLLGWVLGVVLGPLASRLLKGHMLVVVGSLGPLVLLGYVCPPLCRTLRGQATIRRWMSGRASRGHCPQERGWAVVKACLCLVSV